MKAAALAGAVVALLAACAGGPPPAGWQLDSAASMDLYRERYLEGDTRAAGIEFAKARAALAGTGRPALVARAELVRCAVRAASLEFDDCPGFEKLRADAAPEEIAYADFLAGKSERSASDDPLSKLVAYGVKFRSGKIDPAEISAAVEVSSAQGWRRPLLAWLGVEEKRAEAAGDQGALQRIRRRIELVSGGR
ncbi:MAG TPA: hypothetical protein VMI15_09865 [Burkholderiales bacterium]|nr:hypothetical protein [Burkholderiales bacterium]